MRIQITLRKRGLDKETAEMVKKIAHIKVFYSGYRIRLGKYFRVEYLGPKDPGKLNKEKEDDLISFKISRCAERKMSKRT